MYIPPCQRPRRHQSRHGHPSYRPRSRTRSVGGRAARTVLLPSPSRPCLRKMTTRLRIKSGYTEIIVHSADLRQVPRRTSYLPLPMLNHPRSPRKPQLRGCDLNQSYDPRRKLLDCSPSYESRKTQGLAFSGGIICSTGLSSVDMGMQSGTRGRGGVGSSPCQQVKA